MWSFYFRVFWFHMGFFFCILFFVLCFLICICLFLVNIRNLRKEKGPEKVETNSERVVVFYFWPHKKIKKRKKNQKIKEDTHEESPEDCLGWWWNTKTTSTKVEGPECTWLAKLVTHFWLTKDPFDNNIYI
jgi:hypothetical protein